MRDHCIPLEVFNSFVPAEIQLVGKDANSEINYNGRVSIEAKFQDFDSEILRVQEILDIFKQ